MRIQFLKREFLLAIVKRALRVRSLIEKFLLTRDLLRQVAGTFNSAEVGHYGWRFLNVFKTGLVQR